MTGHSVWTLLFLFPCFHCQAYSDARVGWGRMQAGRWEQGGRRAGRLAPRQPAAHAGASTQLRHPPPEACSTMV